MPKGKYSEPFSYTIKCNIAENQSVSKSKGENCKGTELGMLARIFLRAGRMKDVRQRQLQVPGSWPKAKTLPFIEMFHIF